MKQPRRTILLRTGLAILGGLLTFRTAAKADTWVSPSPRVFASRQGRCGLKVVPPSSLSSQAGDKATATLFTLDHRGAENIEWRAPLVNVPHQVFVSDGYSEPAYVVTVDTWGNLGYAHSLVVYGSEGHVTADFALENLLTPDEISKVKRSAGSRWWAEQATFGFRYAPDGMRLVIRMNWGKVITVDLGRGKIVSPSK